MPRELVSVHVGQCGLQMGGTFWAAALKEHQRHFRQLKGEEGDSSALTSTSLPTPPSSTSSSPSQWSEWSQASDAMSTFFSFSPSSSSSSTPSVRARAVLVDMECGVLSAIARSPLCSLFDSAHGSISDVSGSGNNFAQGYLCYGPQYREAILSAVQRQVEDCDSLQSFFLSHSTGGGTGSGLGTAILDALRDEYPDVYLVDQCVLPSHSDDVVTSPYNAVLSVEAITRQADVVLPFDNAALVNVLGGGGGDKGGGTGMGGSSGPSKATPRPVTQRLPQPPPTSQRTQPKSTGRAQSNAPSAATASALPSSSSASSSSSSRPLGGGFADLNDFCASVLCSLTCGMRFPGELNVDWNDLMQNMCPYTNTNILTPAMAPLHHVDTPHTQHTPSAQAASRRPLSAHSSPSTPSPDMVESPFYFHTLAMALRLQSSATAPWSAPSTLHFPSSHSSGHLSGPSYRSQAAMEDSLFSSALSRKHQLIELDPTSGTYLSCAFLCRGGLSLGSVQRQVALWSPQMRFASMGEEEVGDVGGRSGRSHWKLGLCSVPSLSAPSTVLCLSNNSAIASRLLALRRRCLHLFQRRAHWHHYEECGLEVENLQQSLQHLQDVADAYTAVEVNAPPQRKGIAEATPPATQGRGHEMRKTRGR